MGMVLLVFFGMALGWLNFHSFMIPHFFFCGDDRDNDDDDYDNTHSEQQPFSAPQLLLSQQLLP